MARNSRSIARNFNAAMEQIERAYDLKFNRIRVYASVFCQNMQSNVAGYLKGKRAILIIRKRNTLWDQ